MSIYDPQMWDEKVPANVLGGQSRAKTADRDKFGRFMPASEFLKSLWTLPEKHGQKGGEAVLEKYGKDYFKGLRAKRKS